MIVFKHSDPILLKLNFSYDSFVFCEPIRLCSPLSQLEFNILSLEDESWQGKRGRSWSNFQMEIWNFTWLAGFYLNKQVK